MRYLLEELLQVDMWFCGNYLEDFQEQVGIKIIKILLHIITLTRLLVMMQQMLI